MIKNIIILALICNLIAQNFNHRLLVAIEKSRYKTRYKTKRERQMREIKKKIWFSIPGLNVIILMILLIPPMDAIIEDLYQKGALIAEYKLGGE